MGEIQCFDGDGIKHPTLAGTVVVQRCDVMRIYDNQRSVKLKLFTPVPSEVKKLLRSMRSGAEWFQIVVQEHTLHEGGTHRQSFFDLRIDAIQESYESVQCRIHYDRVDPPLKVYREQRHRDKKYNWSITNP